MKNTIKAFLLATLFILSACRKADSKNTETKAETKAIPEFKIDSVKITDSIKVSEKLTLKYESTMLVFPTITDQALLDSIYYERKGITDFSKQGLQNFLNKDKTEYFSSVKDKNNDWTSDIAYPQTWNSGAFMKLRSHIKDFLQIQYLYSSYEGGAHGNYGFSERIFDLKTNKKLQLKDITTMPKARLEQLLFKNINTIPSGTTDSQGAVKNSDMLLLEVIPANENFYFDDKNLYFHYSPYEIAAFAAGDITIPVSWDELKGTLTSEFKERMKIN
ncbi:RsiV family protein [Chryseobacterium chendengshani]|uniref:RsiV family protein n=1 Tax=Chryseobacterium sp. LJ756 TaxID=2864113 RepID=UPI001C63EED0|nr:RsiV family protein [Chryseobacterium sp. LJ756]MBW7674004.1 RsiV family protein [Chryseobacterium sp. LJ756]